MNWLEFFGYAASVLIAVSLMMSNIFKLRIINGIGAFAFALYGLLVSAYPVFAVNAFIFIVDVYYLWKMMGSRDYFKILPVKSDQSAYLHKFVEFYGNDMRKYFPDFDPEIFETSKVMFVLRNMVSVNLVVYKLRDNGVVEILLDYTIPDYRDFKNASFVYNSDRENLKSRGYHTFETRTAVKFHADYLRKIGFRRSDGDSTLFTRGL